VIAEPARIDYASVFPAGAQAMVALQRAVDAAGLEPLLLELVKMRASQINGCAYCLDMHSKDARALGESEQRLHLLAAWREAPWYDSREQAALAWCEDLTLISKQGAADAVYEKLEQTFLTGRDRRGRIHLTAPPTSSPQAPASELGSPQHTHNHEGEPCP
jgi:AhpD family alkylhydroperoxidase